MTPHFERRWRWITLLAVLLLAAFLRLGNTGIVEFKRDEATLSRLSLDLAKGEAFPWLGIGSSVGYPNAPINVYLIALPYLVSDNPIVATLFVAFLNIIAVALLWRLTQRYFGWHAAAIAGSLYAVSPWAVLYSRKIWAQDLLAPFILLSVLTGVLGFLEGKRWAQLLHLPLLAITVQIHFGAISLLPLTLVLLIAGRKQLHTWFGIGVVLAGLSGLPYLYGLYDADLLSIAALRNSLNSGGDGTETVRELSTTSLEYAWFSVAGGDIHSLAGPQEFQNYLDSVPPAYRVFDLIPLAVIATSVWYARHWWRERDVKGLLWILWLGLPILTFTYTWAAPQPHYMIPMLPAAFMLVGVGAASIMQHIPLSRLPVTGGLIVIIGLQLWLFTALLAFIDDHQTEGGFGIPFHYQLTVREAILDENPERVIVVSNGASPAFEQEPAVWDVLLDRVPTVDFLAAEHLWLVPQTPTHLLVSPEVAVDHPWISQLSTPTDQQFMLRPNEGLYQLWGAFDVDKPMLMDSVNEPYANGVELRSIAHNNGVLWLMWRLPSPTGQELPIVFVHGLNDDDERVDQRDLPFLAEHMWQAGDEVLMRVDEINLNDVQRLRVGLYTLLGQNLFQNIEHVDAQGAYVNQWVEIELP